MSFRLFAFLKPCFMFVPTWKKMDLETWDCCQKPGQFYDPGKSKISWCQLFQNSWIAQLSQLPLHQAAKFLPKLMKTLQKNSLIGLKHTQHKEPYQIFVYVNIMRREILRALGMDISFSQHYQGSIDFNTVFIQPLPDQTSTWNWPVVLSDHMRIKGRVDRLCWGRKQKCSVG